MPALSERAGDEIDSEITETGELHRYMVIDADGNTIHDQSFVMVQGESGWAMVDPEDQSSESDALRIDVLQGTGSVALLQSQEGETERVLEEGGALDLPKGMRFRYASPEGMLLRETGPEVVSPRDRLDVIDIQDRPSPPDVI